VYWFNNTPGLRLVTRVNVIPVQGMTRVEISNTSECYSCARHDGEGESEGKAPIILKPCIAENKLAASCPWESAPVCIE